MKTYKIIIALALICWGIKMTFAQEDSSFLYQITEELIREVELSMENGEEEYDISDEINLYDNQGKIKINELTEEDAFLKLHLSDYQYYKLLKYIGETGKIVSFYELAVIDGFNYEEAQRIIPLLALETNPKQKNYFSSFFKRGKNKFLFRYGQVLQRKTGYDTSKANHYAGSPQRYMFKYTFTSGDIFSAGISGEKDPGEEFFKNAQKYGFDFYSGHIQFKNIGWLKSLIIGDYKINWGQGLVLGNGLSLGSSSIDGVARSTNALRPVTAMNESQHFRGVALELGNYKLSANLFFSYRFYDGNLIEDTLNDESYIEGSSSTLGMHRTTHEIGKMNSIQSYSYGSELVCRLPQIKFGARILRTAFTPTFNASELPYRRYYFEGEDNINGSLDYRWAIKRQILFGEFACNKLGGYALLQGAILNFDPRWKVALLFRHYSPNYFAYYANAYGKSSRHNNETGLLINMELLLHPKASLFISSDLYKLHWVRYLIDKPTNNYNLSFRLDFHLSKKLLFNIRYRYENKYINEKDFYYNRIAEYFTHRFVVNMNYQLYAFLSLKMGLHTLFNDYGEKDLKNGILLYQDLILKINRINLTVAGRIALFDAQTFNESISAYENDLTQTFTFCTYYNQGIKGYLVVNYKYRFLSLQCKIAHTLFTNKNVISSNLEEIKGRRKTEIKCQLGLNF